MRSDNHFQLFWITLQDEAQDLGLTKPALPSCRKIPRRFLHVCDIEIYLQRMYFNAFDTVINAINERFDKPGYTNYKNIKRLFLSAISNEDLELWINEVTET